MRDAVLLFDGECGFCSAAVQFVLAHERSHSLRFAPLQGGFGTAALARHPALRGQDSVVWLEPARSGLPELALVRSDAVLRIAGYLGGPWRLGLAAGVLPRSLRDAVYDFVARRRHRIPGLSPRCPVPGAVSGERFIP